jgi:hypothetical protein
MINLCGLTFGLFVTLKKNADPKKGLVDKLCIIVPAAIMMLAYFFDDKTNMNPDVENGVLNVARHSFKCSMRFSSTLEEWLLLWVHFVWSGGLVVVFSVLSYMKVNKIVFAMGEPSNSNVGAETRRKITGQKRRLFRIAGMTSVCLLMNLVITIQMSSILDDWSRSSDLWLHCALYETADTRDWDAYQLQDGAQLCGPEAAIADKDCTSPCVYNAGVIGTPTDIPCGGKKKLDLSQPGLQCDYNCTTYFTSGETSRASCDCSCDDLVKIKKPSVLIMALSQLAQSLVVVIVGLNIGLR